ncbi:hypothetical protein ACLOJK_026944 [Asimina triloba]
MDIKSLEEVHKNLVAKEKETRQKHAIYKLPEAFSSDEKRQRAYKPQVVSLGPYHHHRDNDLKAMEEHKERAQRHFLVRTKKRICDYLNALNGGGEVVRQLTEAYKDLEKEWKEDKERFLKLMLLDGCFLREVLRTDSPSTLEGYDDSDPIFSRHGILSNMPRIKRDMLMVENQIPLLVIKKLLAVERGIVDPQCEKSLDQEVNGMVLSFFGLELGDPNAALGLHVLDVVREGMIRSISSSRDAKQSGSSSNSNKVIWPATQLRRAGIKFRKSESPSLVNVKFEIKRNIVLRKGILWLPQMLVDDSTESKFLNLMAFEHLHVGAGNEVRSYVAFMDNIIDSQEDVILLSQSNIIKNFVGTDQAVADLFNGLSHDVSIDPGSELRGVHDTVTDYCEKPWNQHCAELRQSHFSTPWSVIAVVAASIVLIITIFQFVFMFLSYYIHK